MGKTMKSEGYDNLTLFSIDGTTGPCHLHRYFYMRLLVFAYRGLKRGKGGCRLPKYANTGYMVTDIARVAIKYSWREYSSKN